MTAVEWLVLEAHCDAFMRVVLAALSLSLPKVQ